MRDIALWRACLWFFLVCGLVGGSYGPSFAAPQHSYIVAADGYGVLDCLSGKMECGRVVADSWCEAHGRGHALSFGPAGDITGSIPVSVASSSTAEGPSYVVTCGD